MARSGKQGEQGLLLREVVEVGHSTEAVDDTEDQPHPE